MRTAELHQRESESVTSPAMRRSSRHRTASPRALDRAGLGDMCASGARGKAESMSAQYSLLATTNDSRLRVYDLDTFAVVSLRGR